MPAVTAVIIHKLHAVLGSTGVTRVGKAFIHIPLTALPNKARQTVAVVSANTVYTLAPIEALGLLVGSLIQRVAVIDINFTVNALGASRTGAFVGVDKVNAGSSILAGVRVALINFL